MCIRDRFWVCPLIDDSSKIDHVSTKKRYDYLKKIFNDDVKVLHGNVESEEKEKILEDFLNKKFKILVSTTIIEVGIDFPNANVIVIENANKFGLSQLHQLRGRVGRGNKASTCILMFKSNLSENATKRIKILKKSNDGFFISEEDMKLRGYGDILGFKQSGIKNFKFADPIHHKDLFLSAENKINTFNFNSLKKYEKLIEQEYNFDFIAINSFSKHYAVPTKVAGVGYARKIGLDFSLNYILSEQSLLCSLAADTLINKNLSTKDLKGLEFNPINKKWKKSENLSVNYIISSVKG